MKQQVVLLQTDIIWESKATNFDKVRSMLDRTPPSPGSLVVLPELFAVGFSMDVETICDTEERETEAFLSEVAVTYQANVLGGLVTRADDGLGRNEALAVSPEGNSLARYAKIHPFSYAGETRYYRAGDRVVTFEWHGFVVAPFICYDIRFPEIYRTATLRGAHILVTIANFPAARVKHWTHLLVARAIENQAYVVGVNRCGSDPHVAYPGQSMVVDPMGKIIVHTGNEETAVKAELSLDTVLTYREKFPALKDIRREFIYDG